MTSVGQSARARGDQFFVTHCTTSDCVLNTPGYGVRASSCVDPEILRRALTYPPYQLPLGLWQAKPDALTQAPRRLALTRDPLGEMWVVQSVHLAKDTMGRDRSFFSHLIRLPSVDPVTVLRSWNAKGWVTDYPQGATKVLPRDATVPTGTLVCDETVTAFLSDNPPHSKDLGTTVCPARLRRSAPERRDIFSRVLYAIYHASRAEGRHRIYLHAEPGLVALLLYGAIRLLPEAVTADLTFSTYEPPQSNLRDYSLADVVGTYFGTPGAWVDPALAAQGLVLDTFTPVRSSPVLSGWVPRDLLALVDFAAAGRWTPLVVSSSRREAESPTPPATVLPTSPIEPKSYSAQITRSNPACLLLLVDQSESMNEIFAGGIKQSKATIVADAVNRLLQNVVLRSARADGVRDYFWVGVIGYGKQIQAGLGGSIPFDILIPISRLGAFPLRVETRSKLIPNGVGGLVEQPIKFPVWFDAEASGKTPMCEALAAAGLAVKEFIEKYPNAYPPLVLNLTDGVPSDGNPQENARKLRNLATTDGRVLLFNLLISSQPVPADYFPATEDMLADNFSKLLFRMSSQLPPNLWAAAKAEGYSVEPNARGVVLNADPTAIVRFLDIGTRISHASTEERHAHLPWWDGCAPSLYN